MGFPGFLLQPWREDYVADDQPAPVTPSPPPSPMLTAPPQASGDSGGGFWGGLLGILKNVPITIGDTRKGHVQNLGSYNQLMAGRDLAQWGRDQGLEMQGLGDFPNPDVARFAVQQGLERREKAPIGMETINRLFPVQPGEDPSMAQSRAMLAQIPQHQWGTLASHVVSQYGLPGFGSGLPSTAGFTPEEPGGPGLSQAAPVPPPSPALPQPQGPPPAPSNLPPAAPSTAPLAYQGGPAYPAKPPPLNTQVTLQQQQAHGPVVAAEAAYAQNPTLQNRAALLKARGEARQQILQERQRLAGEAHKQYGEDVRAYAEARKAMKPDWGTDDEMTKQLIMDFPALGQPGAWPTPEQRNISATNLPGRLAADKARETEATTQARLGAEASAKQAWPLSQALSQSDAWPVDIHTGADITTGTLGEAQQRQVRGEARFLTPKDRERLANLRQAAVILREGKQKLAHMYDVLDKEYITKMTPQERVNPMAFLDRYWEQIKQDHPELIETQRFFATSVMPLARGIYGGKGDLNQQELEFAMAAVPQLQTRMTALGSLGAGFGIRIPLGTPQMPDTKEVALSTLDSTMSTINQHAADVLQRPGFQFAGVTPRTEAERTEARETQREQTRRATQEGKLQEKAYQERSPFREGLEKTKKALGLSPGQPAPATTPIQQAKQTALTRMRLGKEPDPTREPEAFQQYMTTFREQARRYFRTASPAELDQLTQGYAQRLGGTWQPQPTR